MTAVDLGVPSVCALDQERLPSRISLERIVAPPTSETTPDAPVHVDDCFCCSHCVNVTALHALDSLALARTDADLPADGVPVPAGYPPYHPPRA